jgi:competence protein ComGC
MKIFVSRKAARALTLIEVLVIIAVLAVLVALILPALGKAKARASRIHCVNFMMQVGVAFKIWAANNGDKYPMQVSVTNGGTMELVQSGVVYRHFQVISNELNSPRVLFCPSDSDSGRTMATTFLTHNLTPGQVPFTSDKNTSYFVGVDATDSNPQMLLAGDRNITLNGITLTPGLHSLRTNELVGWNGEIHKNVGNVSLADGSVRAFTTPQLQGALQNTGVETNRLAMP